MYTSRIGYHEQQFDDKGHWMVFIEKGIRARKDDTNTAILFVQWINIASGIRLR
jgi:hypothetical protein